MAERRKIEGLSAWWTVNSNAQVRRAHRRVPITNLLDYRPTVDLGPEYRGPIPPPGCAADCPVCRWDTDRHDKERGPRPGLHKSSTLRPLDEVVLWAFHGEPPSPPYGVLYLDGQEWKPGNVPNCGPDNVRWFRLEKAADHLARAQLKRQMAGRPHGTNRMRDILSNANAA